MRNILPFRKRSFDKAIRFGFIVISVVVALIVVEALSLGLAYYFTSNLGCLIALIAVTFVLVVIIISGLFYVLHAFRKTIYDDLYLTTIKNMESIANQKNDLQPYTDNNPIIDLSTLNEKLKEIEIASKSAVIVNKISSFKDLSLSFIDETNNVVTYESFVKEHKELIIKCQSFRCAIISYNFSTKEKSLSKEEKNKFINAVKSIFSYGDFLIADNTKNNEYLLFIPNFDSIDRLQEEIYLSLDAISIIRYSQKGHELIAPKVAFVVFPYSELDSILSDLEYAKRQHKPLLFYRPEKIPSLNEYQLSNNLNLNFISSLFEKINSIDTVFTDLKDVSTTFDVIMKEFNNYFRVDHSSISLLDERTKTVVPFYEYYEKKRLSVASRIGYDEDFLPVLNKHVDLDNSYFFSSRDHVSNEIGKFIDVFNIQSGFLFLIKRENKIVGLLTFGRFTPIKLDAFTRHAIISFAHYISNYVLSVMNHIDIDNKQDKISSLLKITDLKTYSVDRKTHEITDYSLSLKDSIPSIEKGKICYEALYDRNKPCENCPFVTRRKMYEHIKGVRHESCLSLTKARIKEATILLTPVNEDGYIVRERFDRDLMINTYYSFIEFLRDSFITVQRGYVVIMNLDNFDELHHALKIEEWNAYLRDFFKDILTNIPSIKDMYFLPNRSFAFVLPKGQHREIIEIIETIYTISKKNFIDNDKVTLNFTYFAHSYPFGYQNSDEYVRYLISHTHTPLEDLNKNLIFMPEDKYIRPASHEEFVNEVLEKTLTLDSFDIRLQPVVRKSDKHIEGAEILLRVSDEYLEREMDTSEIINSAAEHNKISIITNTLIHQIGKFYKEYEDKLIKRYDIMHLSLNTDFSFFQDSSFVDKMKALESTYNIPKDFLKFEISESEIANHYQDFQSIMKNIQRCEITMVCDNYSGKYLPLEKINELGFKGIKVDRSVISMLKDNPEASEGVTSIIMDANKYNLTCTLVGIEFKEEYYLIREIKANYFFQGYYFYRPLSAEELINVLITVNSY